MEQKTVVISDEMAELVANIDAAHKAGEFAKVEASTGITAQTMRNIIKDPARKCQKSTIKLLTAYFKKGKKS